MECRGAAKLATLAPWLEQHAQHLERFDFWPTVDTDDFALAAIDCLDCLDALESAQRLERLFVSLRSAPLIDTAWLAAVPAVRELEIISIASSITLKGTDLPALERLLWRGLLVFAPGAALPQALTRMHVEADNEGAMPAQVGLSPAC